MLVFICAVVAAMCVACAVAIVGGIIYAVQIFCYEFEISRKEPSDKLFSIVPACTVYLFLNHFGLWMMNHYGFLPFDLTC